MGGCPPRFLPPRPGALRHIKSVCPSAFSLLALAEAEDLTDENCSVLECLGYLVHSLITLTSYRTYRKYRPHDRALRYAFHTCVPD